MNVKLFKKICEEEGFIFHGAIVGIVEYSVANPVFPQSLMKAVELSCEYDDDGEPTDEPCIDIFISSAFYPFCKGFSRHVTLRGHYCTEANLRDHLKRVQEAYKQIKENLKVQKTLTVDQFCDMLRDTDVSIYIDSRKAMTKTKITLDKPVAEFLKGFKNK